MGATLHHGMKHGSQNHKLGTEVCANIYLAHPRLHLRRAPKHQLGKSVMLSSTPKSSNEVAAYLFQSIAVVCPIPLRVVKPMLRELVHGKPFQPWLG